MRSIRIGNDIAIQWKLNLAGGEPYNLEGKDLKLIVTTITRANEVKGFSVSGNVLTWVFYGKDQTTTGPHTLTLIENQGKEGMVTVDVCSPFKLVSRSCVSDGGGCGNVSIESLALESTIDLSKIKPVIPVIGDNGNWIVDGVDTGVRAEGRDGTFAYPKFYINPDTGILKAVDPDYYQGDEFKIDADGYLKMII